MYVTNITEYCTYHLKNFLVIYHLQADYLSVFS